MSFSTALSGINAATADLNVISNNIANNHTTGFKSSRAEFADLAQAVTGNLAMGTGVQLAAVTQQFTQGSLNATGNPLDLAINGEGWFRLNDNGTIVYTRSGTFGMDREGFIVNTANQRLTGFLADAAGRLTNTLGDLRLSTDEAPPRATAQVGAGINLDATATPPTTASINPTDPTSFNHSTSLTVFDSLGTAHTLSLFFAKAAAPAVNTWNLAVSVDGTQSSHVTLSGPSLQFTSAGALDPTASPQPITATIDLSGVAAELGRTNGATTPMTLALDFTNTTQFGSPFGVNTLTQDGFASGKLLGVEIDNSGMVLARYTNGQSQPIAQVALANFRNPAGLQQLGASTWAETFVSGQPLIGKAGTGTLGQIQSGALEGSNVELTEQLVNLIRAQRNFQANAQVLSTNNQLLETVINLR